MTNRRVDPPGTTPWDRWHGARIGGFVGAIVSLLPALWVDPFPFGIVLGCAGLGALTGYTVERNRQR
jgi:hypothetical protein